MMRPPVGEYVEGQPEGTVSTHLMKTYEQDGKYYVVPSITHKKLLIQDILNRVLKRL